MTNPQGSRELALLVWVLIVWLADGGADLLQFNPPPWTPHTPAPRSAQPCTCVPAPQLARTGTRPLPLQAPEPLPHRSLRGNRETQGDVIRQDLALNHLTFLLPRPRGAEGSQLTAQLTLPLAAPAVGDKPHGRLALPTGVRQASIIVLHCVLLWLPPQAHLRRITPASVKPLQVALVEPVAYPSAQLDPSWVESQGINLMVWQNKRAEYW